jgi:hypothetical protein
MAFKALKSILPIQYMAVKVIILQNMCVFTENCSTRDNRQTDRQG